MTTAMTPPSDLLAALARCRSFLVTTHRNPDGDAASSLIGMAWILQKLGGQVALYTKDPIPFNFQWLASPEPVRHQLDGGATFDATIVLDCGNAGRVGDPDLFEQPRFGLRINIDHHATNEHFGDLNYVDPNAAATTQLLHRLSLSAGVNLDLPLAEAIYCGIMTDTGSFRYASATPEIFELAAQLVRIGVDPWRVAANVYETQPVERLHLLREVLDTLHVSQCGRYAAIVVTQQMFEDTGSSDEMIDGFINYGRGLRGVELAVLFRESGEHQWDVSFRSRGTVNAAAVAGEFRGGGHLNAAGCAVPGELASVQRIVFQRIETQLAVDL